MAISGAIALGGLFKAVVVGAVVGAVVGGITAAIKGGNIFKGVLFGAIGGAVTGGLVYGAGVAINSIMGTSVSSQVSTGMGATSISMSENVAGSLTTPQVIASTTEKSFLGGLMTDLGDGFKSLVGEDAKGMVTAGALSAGIKGVGDVYMQKKALESAEDQAAIAHERDMEKLKTTIEANKEIAAMSGGGGGGGGGLSMEEQRELIREQNRGAIERVNAEISGQSALRDKEFSLAQRQRDAASAAASAVAATGRTAPSRSEESLVDIQERIRNGEDPEAVANAGYVVPVEYVAPNSNPEDLPYATV